jgi:hypothetical protein
MLDDAQENPRGELLAPVTDLLPGFFLFLLYKPIERAGLYCPGFGRRVNNLIPRREHAPPGRSGPMHQVCSGQAPDNLRMGSGQQCHKLTNL